MIITVVMMMVFETRYNLCLEQFSDIKIFQHSICIVKKNYYGVVVVLHY